MKRNIFFLVLLISCSSLFSIDLYSDYETNEIVLSNGGKEVKRFSSRRYTDFKIYGDKVYFLDCDNSRIQGFGSICYFDINEKFLNDLKIKSGENFLITDKYFIIPSIFESNSTSDIDDIFNQGIGNTKKYILNISIYKKESYELITTFEMGKFIDPHIIDYVYISFQEVSNNHIKYTYKIMDSGNIYKQGFINLRDMIIGE